MADRRRFAVAVAAVLGCALVTAGAFWLLDVAVGDMPSPWWGAAGGAALGLISYVRTGREQRRGAR